MDLNLSKNKYKGRLIVFEGIDGSGKTMSAGYVIDRLRKEKYFVNRYFEPTNENYGKILRDGFAARKRFSPGEEISLFLLDRECNKICNLDTNLKAGAVVILDRYFYSTIAYQGHNVDPQLLFDINKPVIINPDLTLIFDVEVETALERIRIGRERSTSMEEKENLLRAQKMYRSMTADNIKIIDANKDLESMYRDVYEKVSLKIKEKKYDL